MDKPIFCIGVSCNRTYAGREDVPNGTGFIIDINQGGILYAVKFVGDRSNKIYRQVPVSCLKKTTICPVSRPSQNKSTQPSILSPTANTKAYREKSYPNSPPKKEGSPLQIILEQNSNRKSMSSQHYINFLKKDTAKSKNVGFESKKLNVGILN